MQKSGWASAAGTDLDPPRAAEMAVLAGLPRVGHGGCRENLDRGLTAASPGSVPRFARPHARRGTGQSNTAVVDGQAALSHVGDGD
jgi:hypothetical protein